MAQKKKKHERSSGRVNACHIAGCKEAGEYKAPASKEQLRDWRWYCLEHIRDYNRKWNFFAGLDRDEIEAFMKDAVTGHRPTWSRESQIGQAYERLHEALHEFLHFDGARVPKSAPPLAPKLRQALALLDMEFPYTLKDLKARYRKLVKQYHPDVNKHNKQAEETFKKVTAAYRYLSSLNSDCSKP